jgi:hypothetical protein
VIYPGVLAVSMRKYVYAVLLLAHAVPFKVASISLMPCYEDVR